ncbi:MAG: TonB-dependent receptor [Holophagaceae bacterium]|nr:TonB-dependent receptor [Holophagaceae bacterium]
MPFALSSTPNGSRVPSYQRIDLRVNKVFNRDRYKLTVKFEIDNILNHNNWRYYDYQYPVPGTGTTVLVTRNTTMPRLPVVGVSVQF